jgi:hypothetical protein
MKKGWSDSDICTTGIRSKLGPIPDAAFENDAGAAVGPPELTGSQRAGFDKETARLKAERAKRMNRPDLA